MARGERWEFEHFQSRNDIFIAGERVFVDSVLLRPDNGLLASQHRAGRFNCFALLLFIGLPLQAAAERLLQEISARPVERAGPFVCSASPLHGGALLRVAGESVEVVGRELQEHLKCLSALLGDNPWVRKW